MTNRFNTKLLARILADQAEPANGGRFTDARLREAMTTGPRFTADERALLWSSPDARDHYLRVRRRVRLEVMQRVREAGLGFMDQRLAASSAVSEIEGRGFVVTIFHDELPGEEWSISVRLLPAYLSLLPSREVMATEVKLKDTGGMVWVTGIPDEQGSIGAIWTNPADVPHERLKRYTLFLEP